VTEHEQELELESLSKAAKRQAELDMAYGVDRHARAAAEPEAMAPPADAAPSSSSEKSALLAALEAEVQGCAKCDLAKTRNKLVFGSGSPEARLVLVGEEDRQGLPFVGRAGKLLTKMLAYIDLKREEVYICNILKCRPPNNRDPLPDEIAHCVGTLHRQLDIIQPRVILALGRFATQSLLDTNASLKLLRGKVHQYRGLSLVVTYHPAYLLRSPNENSKAKVDLDLAKELMTGTDWGE